MCVYPEKYASSSILSCSGYRVFIAPLTWSRCEFRQVSAKASLGWERGAEASTLSCILRRLAWERSWSMLRLRTMESSQVLTLPRSGL
jgi:hypothetical protein